MTCRRPRSADGSGESPSCRQLARYTRHRVSPREPGSSSAGTGPAPGSSKCTKIWRWRCCSVDPPWDSAPSPPNKLDFLLAHPRACNMHLDRSRPSDNSSELTFRFRVVTRPSQEKIRRSVSKNHKQPLSTNLACTAENRTPAFQFISLTSAAQAQRCSAATGISIRNSPLVGHVRPLAASTIPATKHTHSSRPDAYYVD